MNLFDDTLDKQYFNGHEVYCLEGDCEEPAYVYIVPFKIMEGITKPTSDEFAKRVRVGADNRPTKCRLWFDSADKAINFMEACNSADKKHKVHIAKLNADTRGYYPVETEFGEALICASKLNEDLTEAINNLNEKKMNINSLITECKENFDAYLEGLYSWSL